MRPDLTEPFRKIRKALTIAEVELDDREDVNLEAVNQQLTKIEELVQEVRSLARNA